MLEIERLDIENIAFGVRVHHGAWVCIFDTTHPPGAFERSDRVCPGSVLADRFHPRPRFEEKQLVKSTSFLGLWA